MATSGEVCRLETPITSLNSTRTLYTPESSYHPDPYRPNIQFIIHHHEHKTIIQPIKDPNPTILPEQHWLQDDKTGEIYMIPAELGKKL
jgi:hypothetical protein